MTALRREMQGKPPGSRAALAREAQVSPSAVSDIWPDSKCRTTVWPQPYEKNAFLVGDLSKRTPEDETTYILAKDDGSSQFMVRRVRLKMNDSGLVSDLHLTCDNQAHKPELLRKPFERIVVAKLIVAIMQFD